MRYVVRAKGRRTERHLVDKELNKAFTTPEPASQIAIRLVKTKYDAYERAFGNCFMMKCFSLVLLSEWEPKKNGRPLS